MDGRGFVGPIGDDLPSLIAIMLALTLFFSGLTFAMRTFSQRQDDVRVVKGAVDISRSLVGESVIPSDKDFDGDIETNAIADNNDLAFHADFVSGGRFNEGNCGEDSFYFSYLVAKENGDEITLDTVRVCVWEDRQ